MINTASQAQECFKNSGINVEIFEIKAAFFEGKIFFIADVPQTAGQYACITALSEDDEKVQVRPVKEMFVLDEQHHVHISRTEWVYARMNDGKDYALVTFVTYRDMLKLRRGEKQPCANV